MAFLLKVPSLSSPGTQCRAASPKEDKDIEKGEHSISLVIFQVQHILTNTNGGLGLSKQLTLAHFSQFLLPQTIIEKKYLFVKTVWLNVLFFKVKNTSLCSLLVGSRISIMIWYNETVKV